MSKSTDKQKILDYLMQGNSLTFLDAERMFGTISIRERIRDLRKDGVKIRTMKEQNPITKRFHAIYMIDSQKSTDTEQEAIIRHNNLAQEREINFKEINRQFEMAI